MKTTSEIISILQEFVPVAEDSSISNELLLDKILDSLFKNEDAKLIIPVLFDLLEKYPEADFGAPGPIIHTLEAFSGEYEHQLFLSLESNPVPMTLLMLNRIINNSENFLERKKCIQILKYVSDNGNVLPITKKTAKDFFKYQMEKNLSN